jgi:hypothetical protein
VIFERRAQTRAAHELSVFEVFVAKGKKLLKIDEEIGGRRRLYVDRISQQFALSAAGACHDLRALSVNARTECAFAEEAVVKHIFIEALAFEKWLIV